MGDIVIIGGGFAGLEAARVFARNRKRLGDRRVILIDAKSTSDFLPVLPDVAASFIPKEHAALDLESYLERLNVNFENNEVARIDTQAREVILKGGGVLSFEYLVLACGTVTNFYGQEDVRRRALKLDSADDALVLLNTVTTYPAKKILIVGGGYTGVEVASSLAMYFRRRKIKKYSIHLIERGEDILGVLPEWVRDYCRVNLCALRVDIHTGVSIKEIADQRLTLSSGMEFDDYLLIWTAGVQTPSLVSSLNAEKDAQGRLLVDPYLRFADVCFAAGDAAAFRHGNRALRMAVQFSLAEGALAARNILRLVAGKKKLCRYRPLDLGLLVPMANKKAAGRVLFVRTWGIAGWIMHFIMCAWRSLGANNRMGICCDASKRIFS